jgi:uncharacterized membrane protein
VSTEQSPLFDVLVGLHVGAALASIGSVAATGLYAQRARRRPEDEAVARFFRPGRNLATRSLFLIPVFGIPLVALGRGLRVLGEAWMLSGSALWLLAAALASAVMWPTEALLQDRLVAPRSGTAEARAGRPRPQSSQAGSGPAEPGARRGELGRVARKLALAAALTDAALVAAFVVMVARPG